MPMGNAIDRKLSRNNTIGLDCYLRMCVPVLRGTDGKRWHNDRGTMMEGSVVEMG